MFIASNVFLLSPLVGLIEAVFKRLYHLRLFVTAKQGEEM